jgi:16S rRNA (cytosine1402-N4)-methyltransferase
MIHKSVLLNEVVEYLNLKPGSHIVDATLNGGGHTSVILEKIGQSGKVLGIEWDSEIIKNFEVKIQKSKLKDNLILVNDSYVNLKKIIDEKNYQPDGILFDLGLSSWHYEKSGRGFSFRMDEELDMRFSPESDRKTAAEILDQYSYEKLVEILTVYGEEQFAQSIAKNIVKARNVKPISRTGDLLEIVNASVPRWYKHRKINPATKTFQALRIEVNDELNNVEKGVKAAIEVLRRGGRLVVISFHGLEDKTVREIFKRRAKGELIKWVKRATIKPKWAEVQQNPRARSAKMKVIEKL